MRIGKGLIAAACAAAVLAQPAYARRAKNVPPPPLPTDTLIENVNGYTLDGHGALLRFNGLLIDDKGQVKQLLRPDDKRGDVKFRTDARGRTLLPGMIDTQASVMALGRQLLKQAREAAGTRQLRSNAVDEEGALTRALERLASLGVTMVEDAGTSLDDWLLYRRFGDEGRLSVRIYAMADGVEVLEHVAPLRPTPWLYDARLTMRAVTIAAEKPASPSAAAAGVADARIRNRISRALMAGAQTAVRVNDAADRDQALDAYAEMVNTYGQDRRYRLEAARAVAAADPRRLAELGVVPSARPEDGGHGPLMGIAAASGQGLKAEQALAAYTRDAAYAASAETRLGTLEPGKWADFILVDRDIFNALPADRAQAQVVETWVGGKRVFVRGGAVPPAQSASQP